ncbi:hypothetical protein QTO34_002447 [Cnephaeus nilssonii]|uniref:E3 ubiquitin-protein ligase RNF138 n=1 Tax=Cnephaeus nilssonii TaxID=3371016 RepID=A0AA40HUP9_CNENI|nr:hypothetical protein QTO34_002447 [Eptesicus nilssonii]
MAEDPSAAASYTEDDFYCPVCQEVLKTPVRTAACQHVGGRDPGAGRGDGELGPFPAARAAAGRGEPREGALTAGPRPGPRGFSANTATPGRLQTAEHSWQVRSGRLFCRKCFLTAMRESGIHCPLCRGNVTRRERACPERALDLENIMRKLSGSCRCCAKQIKFYRMRHHYKSCKKYQDEYGVSAIIPNFQISQDSVGNSNRSETSTSDNIETYQENTRLAQAVVFCGRATLKGPKSRMWLASRSLPTTDLEGKKVTCPICVSLPWGDPSQITRNFVSHLNQRHQFDYGEFVNLQLDEETQYQTAVEESFQVNI